MSAIGSTLRRRPGTLWLLASGVARVTMPCAQLGVLADAISAAVVCRNVRWGASGIGSARVTACFGSAAGAVAKLAAAPRMANSRSTCAPQPALALRVSPQLSPCPSQSSRSFSLDDAVSTWPRGVPAQAYATAYVPTNRIVTAYGRSEGGSVTYLTFGPGLVNFLFALFASTVNE